MREDLTGLQMFVLCVFNILVHVYVCLSVHVIFLMWRPPDTRFGALKNKVVKTLV